MDKQNDNTETRAKIGDAINRKVVMTDYETDEVVDAVLHAINSDDDAQENADRFNLLERIEDHTGDLDSALGVLRLAIGDIEDQDNKCIRALFVLDKELRRIKDGLHDVERRMIRARGRENWRIAKGGAAALAPVGEWDPLVPICDDLSMRITWASSVISMIVCDAEVESVISNAAGAAEEHLRRAQKSVKKLRKGMVAGPAIEGGAA